MTRAIHMKRFLLFWEIPHLYFDGEVSYDLNLCSDEKREEAYSLLEKRKKRMKKEKSGLSEILANGIRKEWDGTVPIVSGPGDDCYVVDKHFYEYLLNYYRQKEKEPDAAD